jgi:catechol 2,3-dioxygenase-like lactoylglutathione lyase family enzyme
MLTGIDHLVIAVDDPDQAVAALAEVLGLDEGGGGRHEQLGTFNRLIWLGDTYLELIGVFDRTLAAASWVGAPTIRALDRGGGLATWAIASDDIRADAARLRAAGSDLAAPIGGERVRPDGAVVRWTLAAPPRLDPDAAPFLIEHDAGAAEWTPAERSARAVRGARLRTLEVLVDDVPAATGRLLRTVGLRFRPSLVGGGARDTDIGAQTFRVRQRRGTSLPPATIDVSIAGARERSVDLLGCRWRITP